MSYELSDFDKMIDAEDLNKKLLKKGNISVVRKLLLCETGIIKLSVQLHYPKLISM